MGTWWDNARDESLSAPVRAAFGLGCGMFPWVCLAQEPAEEGAARARVAAVEARNRVLGEAGEGGIFEGLTTAVTAPIRATTDALMWGSIAVGMLILAVLLGLFVWFVALPLMGLGGPRRGVASG